MNPAPHQVSRNRLFPALALLSAIAFGGEGGRALAAPNEVDCGVLLNRIHGGARYSVAIDIAREAVRIDSADQYCYEPIATWASRGLPMSSEFETVPLPSSPETPPPAAESVGQPPMPQITDLPDDSGIDISGDVLGPRLKTRDELEAEKKAATQAGEGLEEGKPLEGLEPGETPLDGEAPPAPPGGAPEGAGPGDAEDGMPGPPMPEESFRCDRDLREFYRAGEIDIKGDRFWLSGVFTMDLDNDGRVDNIGFKIKIKGRVGNLIRYYAAAGQISGQAIPDLRLPDEEAIHWLCPGNYVFKESKEKEEEKEKVEEPVEEKEPEPEPEPEPIAVKPWMEKNTWWLGLGGGALLIISLIALFRELRGEKKTGKEDEDETDDDDMASS